MTPTFSLFKHRAGCVVRVAALACYGNALYFVVIGDAYLLGEITGMLILAIAGMGMMLLTGHTGLPSLGRTTMAFGCYLNINLLGTGLPWLIAFPLSGLLAGALGTMIALPVLRLHGVYLALATLAMSILTSDFVVIAEPWTGGIAGRCPTSTSRDGNQPLFHPLQVLLSGSIRAILSSALSQPSAHADGTQLTAIRDGEISARAMGISLTRTKATSFFLSATTAGLERSVWPFRRICDQ